MNHSNSSVFENLDDAFSFFESRTNLEKGLPPENPNRMYRLDRMNALCAALGHPQEDFRTIHIAGSKGKGSTAAYIAALLAGTGRRVGVYCSPHLADYRERFRLEGHPFPEDAAYSTACGMVRSLAEAEAGLPGDGGATTFELLTLFAFLLFREIGCDTVVLETGLGGRLDATNVISQPEAVVFTPIEKEHTEVLGNRIRDIAGEKAGIFKPGSRAWSARQKKSAAKVFRRVAAEQGGPLIELADELSEIRAVGADGAHETWHLVWRDGRTDKIFLAMGGRIQAENAALALMVTRALEPDISDRAARAALSEVRLPGRFQRISDRPLIVIDGAHTPKSVTAVAESFRETAGCSAADARLSTVRPGDGDPAAPAESSILVFGSALGKNHKKMAMALCGGRHPFFREVIVSTPGTFKPSDPGAVAEEFRRIGAQVSLIPEPSDAWQEALNRSAGKRPILVTGSFYMAGEVAQIIDGTNRGE
ncbi:MAG: Mur ligase family protein [Spirochaetaceae bacterium]|nr:Mur ligase family protein [Spirochaetaceae bacterium]